MANDCPELTPSAEALPPIKTELEVAQDELQALCDRVQDLRRKIWYAKDDVAKACYRGQLIEVVRQVNDVRLDYAADGLIVRVAYSDGGCPVRVNRVNKLDFWE